MPAICPTSTSCRFTAGKAWIPSYANCDGVSVGRDLDVKVHVLPPFWRTLWFWLPMLGLLGGLVSQLSLIVLMPAQKGRKMARDGGVRDERQAKFLQPASAGLSGLFIPLNDGVKTIQNNFLDLGSGQFRLQATPNYA